MATNPLLGANFVSEAVRINTNTNATTMIAALAAAPPPPPIIVRDTAKFALEFDTAKVVEVFRPTRTLVVGQSPRAGDLVPVGTPIDLIVTVKQQLPIEGIKNLHPTVAERFGKRSVGDLLNTLEQAEAKRVFESAGAADYAKLSATDKLVVNDYLRGTFGLNAAEDAAAAADVYDNVKFMVDF